MLEERGRGFLTTVFTAEKETRNKSILSITRCYDFILNRTEILQGRVFLVFPSISRPDLRIQDASVLWEHVNTKQQGSKSFERGGTDNYYNHVLYSSGWTHRGRALGLPLALTEEGFGGVVNNILIAHHLGIEGVLARRVSYTARISYSRNYGVHDFFDLEMLMHIETELPLERRDQVSIALNLKRLISSQYKLNGLLRFAYDWGDLLPDNNFGITLGVMH